MTDPYYEFKPREPTPPEECCSCSQLSGVYLAHNLSDNPIYCMECRGEVAPERIGFDERTTSVLTRWHEVYRAIYSLWLNTSAYEKWAESELLDKDSEVNQLGMKARAALAKFVPTNYLWFWLEERPALCPGCGSTKFVGSHPPLVCEKCSICL